MKHFEYFEVNTSNYMLSANELSNHGFQGWELIQVIRTKRKDSVSSWYEYDYFFKREKVG